MEKLKQYGIVGFIVALLFGGGVAVSDNFGGRAVRATTFIVTATSGPATVTNDVQILATSSLRAYASICNDSGQVVYLGLDGDKPLDVSVGANSLGAIRLNAGNCYEITFDKLYTGAIRASSTNETSSSLLISEYISR